MKFVRDTCLLFAAAVLVGALFVAPARAAEKGDVIHFYTIYGWGKYTDSQYLNMFKKTLEEVSRDVGFKSDFRHFEDKAAFYKEIQRPGRNIVQVGNREELVTVIAKYGYRPVFSYTFLGAGETKTCLYARADGKAKKAADLKGGSLVMAESAFDYTLLRRLLGVAPEKFFSSVAPSGDSEAPAYTFYLHRADALFITSQQIGFIKINNPQIVKNLRLIACSEAYPMLPLLASDEVSRDVLVRIMKSANGIAKGGQGELRAFIKLFKGKAVEVAAEDYKWTIDVFTKAQKDGWVDDFRKITAGAGKR